MDTNGWTPADVARYDQYIAAADEKLTGMIRAFSEGVAQEGEPEAMAATYALLCDCDTDHLATMLVLILRRIALGLS